MAKQKTIKNYSNKQKSVGMDFCFVFILTHHRQPLYELLLNFMLKKIKQKVIFNVKFEYSWSVMYSTRVYSTVRLLQRMNPLEWTWMLNIIEHYFLHILNISKTCLFTYRINISLPFVTTTHNYAIIYVSWKMFRFLLSAMLYVTTTRLQHKNL